MTERCFYHGQARRQRGVEIARGDGLEGTENYVTVGCLGKCDGYDESCSRYRAERGSVIFGNSSLEREVEKFEIVTGCYAYDGKTNDDGDVFEVRE